MIRFVLGSMLISVLALASTTLRAESNTPDADIYAKADNWLCRPGHDDLCRKASATTSLAPDGSLSELTRQPNDAPAIDCFYVYPTVSQERTGNSSLVAGPDEKRVVSSQFSPFASVCRPFAPLYRQITLAGLESTYSSKPLAVDPELSYSDVLAAWKHYLHEDNHGRGFVLIGHSQGSRILARLIAEEIDGKPEQAQLMAAIIPGFNVEVPKGADLGGTFKYVPLCRDAGQSGCVVSYVTFRAETPPPPGARFGRTRTPNMEVACTDPVALSGTPLSMQLPTGLDLVGEADGSQWPAVYERIHTRFFAIPGITRVQCVHDAHGGYLAVSMQPRAEGDKRPTDIPGDLYLHGHMLYDWGLHLIDMNLVMGNLVDFVGRLNRPSNVRLSTSTGSKN